MLLIQVDTGLTQKRVAGAPPTQKKRVAGAQPRRKELELHDTADAGC